MIFLVLLRILGLLIAYLLTPFVHVVNKLLFKLFRKLPAKVRMVISLFVVYLAAIGLIISVSLAIYAVRSISKKK
jgi:hypothetical protein